jgi:hypothetical protein
VSINKPAGEREGHMGSREVNIMQFLNELFVRDMDQALCSGLHYYVFPLICQGIELMGSLLDPYPIGEYGRSKGRFTKALDVLFADERYKANSHLFYKGLRGNMIHQLRVGAGFMLASSKHREAANSQHLARSPDGTYVLVVEVFLADFRKAMATLNNLVDSKDSRLDSRKMGEPFFWSGVGA